MERECAERDCHLPALYECQYHSRAYCGNCLPTHVLSHPESSHYIQMTVPAVDYDTPMELVLRKVNLHNHLTAIRQQGLNMKWMLCANPEHLTVLAKKLLIMETEKFVLWDELQYLKLMTGRSFVSNDPITRMLSEVESDSVAAINGHFPTLPFIEREDNDTKMALMMGEEYQVRMLARNRT